MTEQELSPKEKQELRETGESAKPGRYFIPDVDIFETEDAVVLRADMPGVDPDHVDVELNDDVLTLVGEISLKDYEGLTPVYTEYNVGNYVRRFTLPDGGRLDRDQIAARLNDGVLEVRIPKSAQARRRKIPVSAGA